jgi:hypothetical protein
MDTNQILTLTVFVVVITIVGTIALAAVGYFAFRLRERRNPARPGMDETMTRPYFFERIRLAGMSDTEDQDDPEPIDPTVTPIGVVPDAPRIEAGRGEP